MEAVYLLLVQAYFRDDVGWVPDHNKASITVNQVITFLLVEDLSCDL